MQGVVCADGMSGSPALAGVWLCVCVCMSVYVGLCMDVVRCKWLQSMAVCGCMLLCD